jgi:hypothetical protein
MEGKSMNFYSISDVARMCGVCTATVKNHIARGHVKAEGIGGNKRVAAYRISEDELEAYKEWLRSAPISRGRKKKDEVYRKLDIVKPIFDKNGILAGILNFNKVGLTGYMKLRKCGGFSRIRQILDGKAEVGPEFLKEFCTYFDITPEKLYFLIQSNTYQLVHLRDEYDKDEFHSSDLVIFDHDEEKSEDDSADVPNVNYQGTQTIAKVEISPVRLYYITKEVRTTENPAFCEPRVMTPFKMFSDRVKALSWIIENGKPGSIAMDQMDGAMKFTYINKDTLTVTEVIFRINETEVI